VYENLAPTSYSDQNYFGHHQIRSPAMDGDRKGGIWQAPFYLFRSPHKDGQFLKVWSLANLHNFSNGNLSFSITKKGGMPHVFWEPFDKSRQKLSKNMTTPLLWRLKQFSHHLKNSDDRMAIENFQLPHLVPFQSPWNNTTTRMFFGCHNVHWPNFFDHHKV